MDLLIGQRRQAAFGGHGQRHSGHRDAVPNVLGKLHQVPQGPRAASWFLLTVLIQIVSFDLLGDIFG